MFCAAIDSLRSFVEGLALHEPEVMFRVLVTVLRFDRIAGQCRGMRERQVAVIGALGIDRATTMVPSHARTQNYSQIPSFQG